MTHSRLTLEVRWRQSDAFKKCDDLGVRLGFVLIDYGCYFQLHGNGTGQMKREH